ncbi:hypothetical protein BG015_011952 [Linnemannia schmuckeri]|uniref:FAD-binding domain-containing protein n=1 Tax=Linnemannia schmuckeri TaxID=64567 RepID=A0A9P5V7I6_9FUNG|nr:hypothetical protein BG015_011952 [Linnemannia schmuckeri]
MEINPTVTFKHDRTVMFGKRPKVLIVGGGLGGLTLGILLHKASIPFEIYERVIEVKPFGAAMYFNCTTANFFKQCGIYEEFVALGKPISAMHICNEDRELEFSIDFEGHDEMYGADGYMFSRPQVYDLLLRQVPPKRIHFGKKVLTMEQGGNGVLVRFSDGTEAEGDILVGADGAYSAVRQGLYEKLKKANKLPASDALPLPFSTVCLVAQTNPLTLEEFPDIALEKSRLINFIGTNKMYSWSTTTTAQNTICWDCTLFLDEETSKDNDSFRCSEWGAEAAMSMCEDIKDFPVISGGDKIVTVQDLIDRTPKELISKVMLEEKVFKTWYNCRTVLIGDGVGGSNAMHDAIVLANRINGLPFHPVAEEIEAAFKAYKKERIDWVGRASDNSRAFVTMVGQSTSSRITRYILKHTPSWAMRRLERRQFTHRPQAAFLPAVEDKGSVKTAPQPSLTIKTPVEAQQPTLTQAV